MNSGAVVTVGTFDGVHRGHYAVLSSLVDRAAATGRQAVLVTFEPHPLVVVRPESAPARLTTAVERDAVLATCGLDRVVRLRFDATVAGWSPAEFVDRVLVGLCGIGELVIGYDHRFGRGRSGGVDTLRELGRERGFGVTVVPEVAGAAGPISSTAIRRAVAAGELETAAAMLGRRYSVGGHVERGAARGRTIGYPTANLSVPVGKLLPPDGVWAVVVSTPRGRFGGMMNQGHRPTFDDGRRLLEVNLLGFEGDLYGRRIEIEWIAPLRPIRRFEDAAALRRQLDDDGSRARAILAAAPLDLDAPLTGPE